MDNALLHGCFDVYKFRNSQARILSITFDSIRCHFLTQIHGPIFAKPNSDHVTRLGADFQRLGGFDFAISLTPLHLGRAYDHTNNIYLVRPSVALM